MLEEEYCWAISRVADRPNCGRSGSIVLDLGFKLDCLLQTYSVGLCVTICRMSADWRCTLRNELLCVEECLYCSRLTEVTFSKNCYSFGAK